MARNKQVKLVAQSISRAGLVTDDKESVVPSFIATQQVEGNYFILDPNAAKSNDVSVICAGKESCSAGYSIDRTNFDYFAIEFIASGQCELILNGQHLEVVSAGGFFIYGPNTSHTIRTLGAEPMTKYFVDFSGAEALKRMQEFDLSEGCMFYAGNRRWIQDIYEQFLECRQISRLKASRLCEQLLKLLFVRLSTDRSITGKAQSYSNETFTRCWRYIQENYLEIHSIDEVSRACSVNGVYISRLFKRYASETPYQLLTRLKVCHAAELIVRENLSVKHVGAVVGYHDPYHFSRVFKRVNGLSPKQYASLIRRVSSKTSSE